MYLVSRALESQQKTPTLGKEAVWNRALDKKDARGKVGLTEVRSWRKKVAVGVRIVPTLDSRDGGGGTRTDGVEPVTPQHGYFDNDIATIAAAFDRSRGGKKDRKSVV